MNYLAHALLSSDSPEHLVGALLGDFVKCRVPGHYPAALREAIDRHRSIDRYTDAHRIVHASRALISPPRRRFAAILVDVFYDHFLARHWGRFAALPLQDFTGRVYAALWARRAQLPLRLQGLLPRMMAEDWLASYAELDAVAAAVAGIAHRLRRFARARDLIGAVEELEGNYAALQRQFLAFFPQLQVHVEAEATEPAPAHRPRAVA